MAGNTNVGGRAVTFEERLGPIFYSMDKHDQVMLNSSLFDSHLIVDLMMGRSSNSKPRYKLRHQD